MVGCSKGVVLRWKKHDRCNSQNETVLAAEDLLDPERSFLGGIYTFTRVDRYAGARPFKILLQHKIR